MMINIRINIHLYQMNNDNAVEESTMESENDPRLFTDKYHPKNLNDLDYNFELNKQLVNLAKVKDIPHLMFCGIPGAGKKTRAMLFLKERFGTTVMKVKKKEVSFKYSNKPIEFQFLYSNYHFQIDPSIHGVYDRGIIQDLIKKIMQLQLGIKDISIGSHKIIVIENADKLTQEAQQSLRRTLELYVRSVRFIFLVNNEGNMIEPLQSRCLKLRVCAPTDSDIRGILENIALTEKIDISEKSLDTMIRYSDKNLNTLINQLQTLHLTRPEKLASPEGIPLEEISDIHAHIKLIIDQIFQGNSLSVLSTIRQYVYDLLVNCVTPTEIIKLIYEEVLTRIPDSGFKYKYEIIKIARQYDHTIRLGSKPIYHIEAMIQHLFYMIKMLLMTLKNPTRRTSGPLKNSQGDTDIETDKSIVPVGVPNSLEGPRGSSTLGTGTESESRGSGTVGKGSESESLGSGTSGTGPKRKPPAKSSTPKVKPIPKVQTPDTDNNIIEGTGDKIKIKVRPKVFI
jgi:replication factor C subunit 3/5